MSELASELGGLHLDTGTPRFSPGDIIDERYEIVKPLGAGGTSQVYLCKVLDIPDHYVAIKILYLHDNSTITDLDEEMAVARFLDEVKLSRIITHPNIVSVHELIRSDNIIAFTMEYLDGGDLTHYINPNSPLDVLTLLSVLHDICSALHAIHSLGIIHRDLKPENILVDRRGVIKLTDFGTARMEGSIGIQGCIVGTLAYLSPEYLKDGQVDNRSDIYSLGIIAYELITGGHPFQGGGLIETLQQRLTLDPPLPSKKNKLCTEKLDSIVLKSLAREPELRYQHILEMAEDLERLRESHSYEPSPHTSVLPLNKDTGIQTTAQRHHPLVYNEPHHIGISGKAKRIGKLFLPWS